MAQLTVDDTGHTAIRINLPPIAFNAARISVQLEGEDAAMGIIDLDRQNICDAVADALLEDLRLDS